MSSLMQAANQGMISEYRLNVATKSLLNTNGRSKATKIPASTFSTLPPVLLSDSSIQSADNQTTHVALKKQQL